MKKNPEDFGIINYKWNNGKLDCFQGVDLYGSGLTKLPFNFGIVEGYFDCSHNKLTSLEGCPSSVEGYFYCHNNNLTSLEGCPSSVGGGFYCSNNNLTSLEGCPSSVGGGFDCSCNYLTSLEGCPSSVGGDFCCHNNKVGFTEEDIKREILRSKLKDQDIKDKDLDNLVQIRSLFNR